MAVPAANSSVNANSATASPVIVGPGLAPGVYVAPGIYLAIGESPLFVKWLALPHPEIQIEAARAFCANLPRVTRALGADVRDNITPEQERRFSFVAQRMDIVQERIRLGTLRKEMVELFDVLLTEMQEALGLRRPEAWERLMEDMKRREPAADIPRTQPDGG